MSTNYPSITFVCCVESGSLETQTVRMIESVRRWGGKFAHATILAVTPRFGSPLANQTQRAFERLNVTYLRFQSKSSYSWFGFLNKPYALLAAEDYSTSEFICWLDSDLLFLDEPELLLLQEGEDFAASSDRGGTTGLEDSQAAFWNEAGKVVGVEIEKLPWIVNHEGKRTRLYFNSGVVVYRRSTGLGNTFLQACIRLLDARIANAQSGIFFTDQVALALAVGKMRLLWKQLPQSHNYSLSSKGYPQRYNEDQLKQAKILHYHDSMWPWFWPTLIQCLEVTHPSVAEWLSPLGHLKNDAPLPWRMTGKILKNVRSLKQSSYIQSCRML